MILECHAKVREKIMHLRILLRQLYILCINYSTWLLLPFKTQPKIDTPLALSFCMRQKTLVKSSFLTVIHTTQRQMKAIYLEQHKYKTRLGREALGSVLCLNYA